MLFICSVHYAAYEQCIAQPLLHFIVPVVTVAEGSVTVQLGENFTLSCSSSIPNLPLEWVRFPGFDRRSGPTFAVMGATPSDEGEYRCSVLENGEVVIASATVRVDVILSKFRSLIDVYVMTWRSSNGVRETQG